MGNKTPDSLVKFCDTVTAEKILSSQALRWSAPHLFVDPFELNHESQLGFTPDDLLKATVKRAANLIFSPDQPVGSTPIMQAIRRWRSEDRFSSPEEAEEVLTGLLEHMVNARLEYNQRFMASWRDYCLRLRICCFTSRLDNPLAWQYFGDNHRGVGLRFGCSDNGDFASPSKVTYQDYRPEISRLSDQVQAIIDNIQDEHQATFTDKFLTKARALAHEREWRCFKVLPQQSNHGYSDLRFKGNDLKAICFGLQTSPAEQKNLTQLALAINPKVRVYQSTMRKSSYTFEFARKPTTPRASPNPTLTADDPIGTMAEPQQNDQDPKQAAS